jgi:Raf kinase inhibitor-like YbhB/YbcL family protein
MTQSRSDTSQNTASRKKVSKPLPRTIELTSSAFADGGRIPDRHTAFGEDVSPTLAWGEVPEATVSLALICDDPDSRSGSFVHWLLWEIAPDVRILPENVDDTTEGRGLVAGENGFGSIGYAGPEPPPGKPHRYVFRLKALDTRLELPKGASRDDFERAIDGHILAEGVLIGTYGR